MTKYPEHEKMRALSDRPQLLGDFLAWLSEEKRVSLCEYVEDDDPDCGQYYPKHFDMNKLLAEFFDIDLDKIEEEKGAMLEELRSGGTA